MPTRLVRVASEVELRAVAATAVEEAILRRVRAVVLLTLEAPPEWIAPPEAARPELLKPISRRTSLLLLPRRGSCCPSVSLPLLLRLRCALLVAVRLVGWYGF